MTKTQCTNLSEDRSTHKLNAKEYKLETPKHELKVKSEQLQKGTMYKLQMPKPTRNNCKNGNQTNLLAQGARSTKFPNDSLHIKTLENSKVCITHQSDKSHLYLVKYVSKTK